MGKTDVSDFRPPIGPPTPDEVMLVWRDLSPADRAAWIEMGRETASEMERLRIDAVGIAWLDYYLAHLKFTQVESAARSVQDHFQKRLDRALNRYLKSIKTQATVRKMAFPTLIALQADIRVANSSPRL
ncbi:MAG: hypothetical protein Q8M16_12240 [Pirellulaceae bacterium]|nr:hypothetical protein [Pirellulaceae bacterium]